MATAKTTKTASRKAAKTGAAGANAVKSGKTIVVCQTASPIGRRKDQRATLVGLGLNKLHRRRELPDTPEIRGMLRKVHHLVTVEESAA